MRRIWLLLFTIGLPLFLIAPALMKLPRSRPNLTAPSVEALPQSGVGNPVTAVLLNYRGYDTLLEVGVLLLVVIAVWSLQESRWRELDASEQRPLLMPFLRLIMPVLVLVSGYLLWIGSSRPGGAFQGGAMIGGAMVMLISAGLSRRFSTSERRVRAGLVVGLTVFMVASVTTLLWSGHILCYRQNSASSWILAIEVAAQISIGVTLGALFLGGRPRTLSPERPKLEVNRD